LHRLERGVGESCSEGTRHLANRVELAGEIMLLLEDGSTEDRLLRARSRRRYILRIAPTSPCRESSSSPVLISRGIGWFEPATVAIRDSDNARSLRLWAWETRPRVAKAVSAVMP
jgi:hypothetical protein